MQEGTIALIGSGETAASGGQTFEALARDLPVPLKAAVLETPAGFEGNSAQVAGRVADLLNTRLQNYRPQVEVVAARKNNTAFSPNNPQIVETLYDRDLIFLGPGSPSYTVRQLKDSLAWQIIQARHRLGASLALASAAAIAAGTLSLPVYEIYKVGEDPHWKPGLELFRPYGLSLIILPHWNNHDGGDELDTSRCFMGRNRFDTLLSRIPNTATLLGIDEHTTLLISLAEEKCRVIGQGEIHILRSGGQHNYTSGEAFSITALGSYQPLSTPKDGLSEGIWDTAQKKALMQSTLTAPEEVQELLNQRQIARQEKDWSRADKLREQIAALGWTIQDTGSGPILIPKEDD